MNNLASGALTISCGLSLMLMLMLIFATSPSNNEISCGIFLMKCFRIILWPISDRMKGVDVKMTSVIGLLVGVRHPRDLADGLLHDSLRLNDFSCGFSISGLDKAVLVNIYLIFLGVYRKNFQIELNQTHKIFCCKGLCLR